MSTPDPHRSLNVLLAFDGSQHCLSAIDLLRDLPLPESSTINIVGVLIPRESSNHAILEAALDQADQMLKEKGFDSKADIIVGNPAETIIEWANKIHPDLIVAGAKGLRHTLGILLGGVAQQIVEYAGQPVLVVRAPYQGLKHIVLVTDGSPFSQAALEYMAGKYYADDPGRLERFPLPAEAQLTIMHVLPPPPSPELLARSWPIGPDVLPPIPMDREAEAAWLMEEETRGRAILERAIEYLNKTSGIQATPLLARGDAATEVIQFARDHQVDLIVAGSRGLSEIRSWLLGSVSRKLVHYANCSVLIVKGHPPGSSG